MKTFFLILSISLLTYLSPGQNVKEDFNDAEFFLAQEEYEEALYIYQKVYENGYRDNANVNYRIGICLLEIRDRKPEAIPYLEKAVESISERYKGGTLKELNAPPDALLYLGNAYRINQQFEKACENYNKFLGYLGDRDNILKIYTEQEIAACQHATNALANPVDYTTGNLGQLKDVHSNVYNVVVSDDQKTMAFMGKNPFYNGVYVSEKNQEGLWDTPLNITPSIQSDGNMDVVSLSADGKIILLAVHDEFDSNIYTSEYANDRWNKAKSLGNPINSRYYESHADFSPDGKSVYFTSNRKESLGGTDIFRSDLQEDQSWSNPVNLGPTINTQLNEESPFVSPDGSRLWFSSQGHSSIGGFDLFYSELQPDGSWGTPVNPGYPLNTPDDDYAFSPVHQETGGVQQVFAKGNASQRDIYFFELIGQEEQPVAVSFDKGIKELAAEVAETGEQPAEEAEELAAEVAEEAEELAVEVSEEMEEAAEEVVEELEEEVVPEEPVEEVTEPLAKHQIRPIFFAFDSYALSPEGKTKLDNMAKIMNDYPGIKIDVIGHTDAVGTYEYNQGLSENRASAVINYLVTKGIAKDRLTKAGMSESQPVARNRTPDNRDAPEGRRFNRRVQFTVTLTEDVIIEIEQIQVPDHLKIN